MIKQLSFVRRKPGLTQQEFHARWRDHHAQFFAANPEARRLLARYELNHRLADDYTRKRHAIESAGTQWDGVAVQWFDSLDDYRALQRLPAFTEFVREEQARYRDADTASVLTNDATVIVDKPGQRARAGLKLICILRGSPALERKKFFKHWREHHGGLFQNIPELYEPLMGYDQNHGLDIEGAEYDGVTEQWFESLPVWMESIVVPAAKEKVDPDVAYFLDTKSIQFILAGQPTVVVKR